MKSTPESNNATKSAIVYIDYAPKSNPDKPFALYEKQAGMLNFFDGYTLVDRFKTLDAAEECGVSRAQNVQYKGIYEDGKKKGMTGWYSNGKIPTPTYKEYKSQNDEEIEVIRMPRNRK
jgi:hypothetical protein